MKQNGIKCTIAPTPKTEDHCCGISILFYNIEDKALTTLAFVIGLALIDNLSSTEQNAVGNWIMLIAQTLCTNGSYTFNKEWKSHINNDNTPVTKDTLEKVGNIINNTIRKNM